NAGSRGGRLRRAGLCRAGAASRLSCRGFHGQGRGSAAKSGEERDGGIEREAVGPRHETRRNTKQWKAATSAWRPFRWSLTRGNFSATARNREKGARRRLGSLDH